MRYLCIALDQAVASRRRDRLPRFRHAAAAFDHQLPSMLEVPASAPAATETGPRRALLIANANSRRGAAMEEAREALESVGLAVTAVRTESRAELTPLILDHAADVDCVVAAGGDGTMNGVADGLVQTGLPLGILPMGTANDLARTLDIPVDLPAAARIIAAGRRRRIDLGEVNEHAFFNVASIGLSAELASRLTPERKRRFGRFAYAITAMHVLATARPFRATIVTKDATKMVRTLQIAVGNGKYYGGGMAVEAGACIADGRLDLYSLEFKRVWKLALLMKSFRQGAHGLWSEVRTEKSTAFEIRTRKPMPINTDGDLVTFTPARFVVKQGAIEVFAP
jgi:diacylglycerol kinase (ATP)